MAKRMTIGTPTLVEKHLTAILDLIQQGDNSYGSVHGSGERLVHLCFLNRFHFISRDWSTMFREQVRMISIRLFPEGEITRPGPGMLYHIVTGRGP